MIAIDMIASNLAKKVRGSTADTSRACSNREGVKITNTIVINPN